MNIRFLKVKEHGVNYFLNLDKIIMIIANEKNRTLTVYDDIYEDPTVFHIDTEEEMSNLIEKLDLFKNGAV